MAESDIPDKLTFRRKEVMQLTKLDGRVLDYWEKEFAAFAPVVNRSGDQFYSRRDVEVILAIKKWLILEKHDKGEIKNLLLQNFGDLSNGQPAAGQDPVNPEKLKRIRRTLKEILTLLAKDDKN
jgi:DNA-binding transcriptional MerR regulator